MNTSPLRPQVTRSGIVLVDTESGRVERVVVLQLNPDSLKRSLQIQGAGPDAGDRLAVFRLKGAPIETITFEAEIDAADQLGDRQELATRYGIQPHLAALETCVYPRLAAVRSGAAMASAGTVEILGPPAPMTLFVWGTRRILPVRITELSITEEAFTPALDPLRAQVSLGLRVLTVADVPSGHRAAALLMARHASLDDLARLGAGRLPDLGIGGAL